MDSFKFAIRKQLTSHLCMRSANKPKGRQATRRGYGATTHLEGEDEDDEFGFVTLVSVLANAAGGIASVLCWCSAPVLLNINQTVGLWLLSEPHGVF